ncbi:MAG: hypothetical protein J6L62_04895 [Clostridia bacterium]|nr:hypothetical protein [Clostridia bacterium]
MAKTKAPKEKKGKNTAQVTAAEYSDAVVMTNFIVEIQKVLEKTSELSDVHFVPKMDGYRVFYKADGKDYKITVDKKILTSGFSVKKYVDGFKKASASFRSPEQYPKAVAKIFDGKKDKAKKKK